MLERIHGTVDVWRPEHEALIAALTDLFGAFGIKGALCGANEQFNVRSATEIIRFAAKLRRKAAPTAERETPEQVIEIDEEGRVHPPERAGDGLANDERAFCWRFMRALGFGAGGMLDSIEQVVQYHKESLEIAEEEAIARAPTAEREALERLADRFMDNADVADVMARGLRHESLDVAAQRYEVREDIWRKAALELRAALARERKEEA